MSVFRYFHTIRYLRPVQIYGRLLSILPAPAPGLSAPPSTRDPRAGWQPCARREPSLIGPTRFRFLNAERNVSGWNPPDAEKLWVYNLHYFDDLNASGPDERDDWHRELLERWVAENPPSAGVGWEPYPTSLRIVNWVKWSLSGHRLSDSMVHSLAVQCRHLARRVESHLLGNHVFANAKALLFGGLFFEGEEAARWRRKGESLLMRETIEQVLPDGGHFERSPMYHSIVLEDMLDCINVMQTYGVGDRALRERMFHAASSMVGFLRDILHDDGELPFFNDTALGVSSSSTELTAYADRLGVTAPPPPSTRIVAKPDFGLWVLSGDSVRMIVDAGRIGPDYLPGHAHCDTLSYEMSINGRRFVVNSGVFTYQGAERSWFRSTAAHNTVRIDGEEQHEIWSAFRVARRGYPVEIGTDDSGERLSLTAAHTGYRRLPGGPLHRRTIGYANHVWSVDDRVEGAGAHRAESYIHLHPDVEVAQMDERSIQCRLGDIVMTIHATDCDKMTIEDGFYSPEFGLKLENRVVLVTKEGPLPFSFGYRFEHSRG